MQALGRRQRLQQVADLFQQRVQVEGLVVEHQLARLDARQVERIVDQVQQVVAGALDRLDLLALPRREFRSLQQFGHAEHAGHRGADLVAEHRQEATLRLRALVAELALLVAQLPRVAATQAPPVIARQHHQKHQQSGRGQRARPGLLPPGRQHAQAVMQRRGPGALGVAGGDLEPIVARLECREIALALAADEHPIRVEAMQAKAVAVRAGVGEGQQARGDPQLAIVGQHRQHAGVGVQRHQVLVASQGDGVELEPRRLVADAHLRRIEQQQAAGRAGQAQTLREHERRPRQELLVGQAVAHAEAAQAIADRIVAPQSAHRGQPQHAAAVGHQAAAFDRGQSRVGAERAKTREPAAVPVVGLELIQAVQPQGVRRHEGEAEHAIAGAAGDRPETTRARIPAPQALAPGQPDRAVGPERELVGIASVGAVAVARQEAKDTATVAGAGLDAFALDRKPQQAVAVLQQGEHGAGADGIGTVATPVLQPARRIAAGQSRFVAQPKRAVRLLEHGGQRNARHAGRKVQAARDLTGEHVEFFHQPARADQPGAAIAGRADTAHRYPRQPALATGEHRELPPARRQVQQAGVGRQPDATLAILDQVADAAGGRSRIHPSNRARALAHQAARRADPVRALAIVQDRVDGIRQQRGLRERR